MEWKRAYQNASPEVVVFGALELEGLIKGLLALDIAVRVWLLLLWRRWTAVVWGWLAVLWVWRLLVAGIAVIVSHGVLLLGLPITVVIIVVVCLAMMRHRW